MVGKIRIHTVSTSSHVYNSFTATNFWNYSTYGPTLHLHTQKYNNPFNLKLDVDNVLIIPLTRPHPPSPEVLFGFYRPTKINLYNAC